MNIGKAASLSGLTVKTVRYYSDIGIIKPDIHTKTGYRQFSNDDVAKLQFVGKARKFNFGIEECRELLALYENNRCYSSSLLSFTFYGKLMQKLGKTTVIEHTYQNVVATGLFS